MYKYIECIFSVIAYCATKLVKLIQSYKSTTRIKTVRYKYLPYQYSIDFYKDLDQSIKYFAHVVIKSINSLSINYVFEIEKNEITGKIFVVFYCSTIFSNASAMQEN